MRSATRESVIRSEIVQLAFRPYSKTRGWGGQAGGFCQYHRKHIIRSRRTQSRGCTRRYKRTENHETKIKNSTHHQIETNSVSWLYPTAQENWKPWNKNQEFDILNVHNQTIFSSKGPWWQPELIPLQIESNETTSNLTTIHHPFWSRSWRSQPIPFSHWKFPER